MLSNRIYYLIKPFLPLAVRTGLRRSLAKRQRRLHQDTWPIDQNAGKVPSDWPGWPNGKRFAFVLTHDVEGAEGLQKCRSLMELEMKEGFRSSYNIIPQGNYQVSKNIRDELTGAGFEVGVHDLRHDGKLFSSRRRFRANAVAINRYLEEWGAVGFRAGFMLRNLEWLHDLNILYDASTFDTDPFEPQPDGEGTIFPFIVGREGAHTYVELPYTLTQDSTLFIYLQEKSIDIWKKKIDWIVERGGMVLANIHPDYIAFENEAQRSRTYPVSLYRDLLRYVKEKYAGEYWQALPREVATYCRKAGTLKPRSRKHACMVSYSFYATDNRVMRYADALAERGDSVDVISLRGETRPEPFFVMNGVRVYGIQERIRNEKGKATYFFRIFRFLLKSSVVLAWKHLQRPYDVVHVHNIPDFLVFAAWLPKLMGARIILDIHDILPEFFANKFEAGQTHWAVKMLFRIERASCQFADYVIIANHIWHQKIIQRSVAPEICSVVLNYVDPKVFHPRDRVRNDGRKIAIFPGSLQHHQGVDLAVRAFAKVIEKFPTAEFHIYGEGSEKPKLMKLTSELGLEKYVIFCKSLPLREIAGKIAEADLGVVPKRADSFGNEAYSTKIMEFMSQGLPVIAARTRIDTFYFDDNTIRFFKPGDADDLAKAIIEIWSDKKRAAAFSENSIAYVAKNNWDLKKHEYFAIVDGTSAPGNDTRSGRPTRPVVQVESVPV